MLKLYKVEKITDPDGRYPALLGFVVADNREAAYQAAFDKGFLPDARPSGYFPVGRVDPADVIFDAQRRILDLSNRKVEIEREIKAWQAAEALINHEDIDPAPKPPIITYNDPNYKAWNV